MRRFTGAVITPTVVVFVAVMVVVGISFFMARNNTNQEIDRIVSSYRQKYQGDTQDRFNIFEETLRAGLGLLAGNPNFTQAQWEKFISTSAVLKRYQGASSVAYAQVVNPQELTTFTDQAKAKVKPDFAIHPAPDGKHDWYVPITFIAPHSDTTDKVIGFDIASQEDRQKAILSAATSGDIAISDVVQSLVDDSESGRSFIMYAPQYKPGMPIGTPEQRRAATAGFVYVGFRLNNFMESIDEDNENGNIGVRITSADGKTFYESKEYTDITNGPHDTRSGMMDVGSTTLNFTYAYRHSALLPGYMTSRPLAILVFGVITAILISSAVWLVLRAKADELLLEKERGINEAKDNLLSLASHQLRTPATGVKQYLGLILQGFVGDVTPQQRALLEKANASNERQLKTINDVLYLAKLSSGRIVLTRSTFSVARLVEDLVLELDENIAEKQHKIELRIPKRQKDFYGDEHMIRMAIENLLTNAIKYTHKKGRVTVRLMFGKTDLKVQVSDNGVGIPVDQQIKMFKQFERIDNELSVAVGGSGIGLYVTQNVASLHDGHIEVMSEAGKGAQFTLVLPFVDPPENDKV